MRWDSLMLITFLTLWAMIPLTAQGVLAPGNKADHGSKVGIVRVSQPVQVQGQARPEAVVARLMSFDANHDGRITPAELPERMQPLLARADLTRDGALDGAEVLRLAQAPPAQAAVRGLQPGHYGFGDEGELDTRLHIEGAIEDLRLASATREKALGIGRQYAENMKTQAKANLLAVATRLLSAEQLTKFKAALDRNVVQISPMPMPKGTTGTGNQERLQTFFIPAAMQRAELTRLVTQYDLGTAEKRQLQAAVQRFTTRDRLNDADRTALLKRMGGLLSDEQRDDLRAALERRPIIKQDGGLAPFRVSTQAQVMPAPPPPPKPLSQPQSQFGIRDLVLRK